MSTETTFSTMQRALAFESTHGWKEGNYPRPKAIAPYELKGYLQVAQQSGGEEWSKIQEVGQQYAEQFHENESVKE